MGGFVMDSGIENATLRDQVLKALDTADTTFFDDFLSAFSPLLPLVKSLGLRRLLPKHRQNIVGQF